MPQSPEHMRAIALLPPRPGHLPRGRPTFEQELALRLKAKAVKPRKPLTLKQKRHNKAVSLRMQAFWAKVPKGLKP